MKFYSWLNVSIYLLSFGDINKSNSLPPKLKSQYAKQKDELICKPKNLGKLKKNTTCMKENKGSLIFFHHLQVSMRSFSSSIRKTSQFLLCWNSYGWSNILFVLGRASKRSSLLLNLEELNFVDISPDWTYSSTRFVSLFFNKKVRTDFSVLCSLRIWGEIIVHNMKHTFKWMSKFDIIKQKWIKLTLFSNVKCYMCSLLHQKLHLSTLLVSLPVY